MRPSNVPRRLLGTMVTYGFPRLSLSSELDLALGLGADAIEVLPHWRDQPDPAILRRSAAEHGVAIHSVHGCWGGQTIESSRVDLGETEPLAWHESVDDLKRCLDWMLQAGGTFLVVHPGGLSDLEESSRREAALIRGLDMLAAHTAGSRAIICVENMPPGVHPGSRMADLRRIVDQLDHPRIGLALDTGHAHMSADVRTETLAAGPRLRTTHVHDNDGRHDVHLPPGRGTIDWLDWARALDEVDYRGLVMLECIRKIREAPESWDREVVSPLLD